MTSIGPITIRMNNVRDTVQNWTRKPLVDRLQCAGKKVSAGCPLMKSVGFAQKPSYHETVEELSLVIPGVPSRMTINKRDIEFGESIKTDQQCTGIPVVITYGTKSHSQEPGMKQNHIHVVLGVCDGRKVLLGVMVNQSTGCPRGGLSDRFLSMSSKLLLTWKNQVSCIQLDLADLATRQKNFHYT